MKTGIKSVERSSQNFYYICPMKKYCFGFNLDYIQDVQEYVKENYSTEDYKMHLGYGDDVMNCLEINEKENDNELRDLIDACREEEGFGDDDEV
jgi:hypothetical protein